MAKQHEGAVVVRWRKIDQPELWSTKYPVSVAQMLCRRTKKGLMPDQVYVRLGDKPAKLVRGR